MNINIREINGEDDLQISQIIKSVMTEFNADPKTTVLADQSINEMSFHYKGPKSAYFIVEEDGVILGGSGVKQLDGTEENVCELQRMFLLPSSRGKGYGKALISLCVDKAKEFGYDEIYLESLSQMKEAIRLYEKTGF